MIRPRSSKLCIAGWFSSSRMFLFAGQGTQDKGMLDKLREPFRREIEAYSQQLDLDFLEITGADSKGQLNKTWVAQPLIVMSQWLHFKLSGQQLRRDDVLIGHSVGEYTALALARSLDIVATLKLVKLRGQLIAANTSEESGMLVVIARKVDLPVINELAATHRTEVACYNTPSQLVLAGSKVNTQALHQEFKKRKILSTFLPVSAAFHCSSLRAIEQPFRQALEQQTINPPQSNVIRNIDATPYTDREDIIDGLTRQLYSAVRFEQSVSLFSKDMQFVEVGHKPVLTRFMREIRSSM